MPVTSQFLSKGSTRQSIPHESKSSNSANIDMRSKSKGGEETLSVRVIPRRSVVMTTSVTWPGRIKLNDRHLVAISLIPRVFPARSGTMVNYFKQWPTSN
jgi:hypothetical protein